MCSFLQCCASRTHCTYFHLSYVSNQPWFGCHLVLVVCRCFADTAARHFDAHSAQILSNFAELVTRELEKDIVLAVQQHETKNLHGLYGQLLRSMDAFAGAILCIDTSKEGWPVVHANAAFSEVAGMLRQSFSRGSQLYT